MWCLLAWPLAAVSWPDLIDWPNHVARHHIARALPAEGFLAQYYDVSWRPIPNLAADIAVRPLLEVFSARVASKLVLAFAMATWLASPVLLYRAVWGRWSVWPLMAGLVVYNSNLAMGFENFYVALPWVGLVLAGWIGSERRPLAGRLVALGGAATLLWFGHLVVWGLLGLCIALWELEAWLHEGGAARALRRSAPGLAFLPGAALFVHQASKEGAQHGSGLFWGTMQMKLDVLLSPTEGGHAVVDLGLLVLLVGILVGGLGRGALVLERRSWALIGGLSVSAVAMPHLLSGVSYMDLRIPALFALVMFGMTRPAAPSWEVSGRLVALVLIVAGVRGGSVASSWIDHDRRLGEMVRVVSAELPEGAKLLATVGGSGVGSVRRYRAWHSPCWLVIERAVFVPTLFSGAHLLIARPEVERLTAPQAGPLPLRFLESPEDWADARNVYWRSWREDFDYVIVLDPEGADRTPDGLELVRSGEVFELYRIHSRNPP